jgi:hypothetical protein
MLVKTHFNKARVSSLKEDVTGKQTQKSIRNFNCDTHTHTHTQNIYRVFQKEPYNSESLHEFIQRKHTVVPTAIM